MSLIFDPEVLEMYFCHRQKGEWWEGWEATGPSRPCWQNQNSCYPRLSVHPCQVSPIEAYNYNLPPLTRSHDHLSWLLVRTQTSRTKGRRRSRQGSAEYSCMFMRYNTSCPLMFFHKSAFKHTYAHPFSPFLRPRHIYKCVYAPSFFIRP